MKHDIIDWYWKRFEAFIKIMFFGILILGVLYGTLIQDFANFF